MSAHSQTATSSNKAVAAASIRRSGIDDMRTFSATQRRDADDFRRSWAIETAEPFGLGGIDYKQPIVDGGRLDRDGGMVAWVQARKAAHDKLTNLHGKIGDEHFRVLKLFAGEERSFGEVAKALRCAKSTAIIKTKRALDMMSLH